MEIFMAALTDDLVRKHVPPSVVWDTVFRIHSAETGGLPSGQGRPGERPVNVDSFIKTVPTGRGMAIGGKMWTMTGEAGVVGNGHAKACVC